MPLTRDQVFALRASLPTEDVEVPELGGTIRIRLLTLAEVQAILQIPKTPAENAKMYVPIVEKSCVNEDGTQMFVGEDVKQIGSLPWGVIEAIVKAAMRHNKMAPEENGAPKG
jgi:hypothetical protein